MRTTSLEKQLLILLVIGFVIGFVSTALLKGEDSKTFFVHLERETIRLKYEEQIENLLRDTYPDHRWYSVYHEVHEKDEPDVVVIAGRLGSGSLAGTVKMKLVVVDPAALEDPATQQEALQAVVLMIGRVLNLTPPLLYGR